MKHLIFASLLLSAVFCFGQSEKFTFKLGDEYKFPKKSQDLSFFGNDKGGVFNLCLKDEAINVLKFDLKTLNSIDEKVIQLPEQSKYFNSETIVEFGNNYYWIHSDYDKSNKSDILYYDKIDPGSGTITEANHKISSTSKLGGYNNKYKYSYRYNVDKTKLLVNYMLPFDGKDDRKDHDNMGLQVFDDKMNKLWGEEFTMPYTQRMMKNIDYSIDAEGNVYLLIQVYDTEKRTDDRDKKTGLYEYHYEVLKFTKGSKNFTTTTVTAGDNFIRYVSLIKSPTNDILVSCSYGKKAKGDGTDGIFVATIDQQGKLNKYKNGYYELPLAELQKYDTKKVKKSKDETEEYEIPYVVLREINTTLDGGLFMSFEQYHATVKYVSQQSGVYAYWDYYYDNILPAKLNSKGDFEWIRIIPKKQKGTAGVSTSYISIADQAGYYFLFFDNKKNRGSAEEEAPETYSGLYNGMLIAAKVDLNGGVTKEVVFDSEKEEVKFVPSDFHSINSSQFIGKAAILGKGGYKPIVMTVH